MASVWGPVSLLLYSAALVNITPTLGNPDPSVYEPHYSYSHAPVPDYGYRRGHDVVRHVTVHRKRRPRPRIIHRTVIVEEEPHVEPVHVVERVSPSHVGSVHVVRQQPPVLVQEQPVQVQVVAAAPAATVPQVIQAAPATVPQVIQVPQAAVANPATRVTLDPTTGRIDPRLIPVLRGSTPQQGDPLGIYPGAGLDPRVDPSLVGVARTQLADQVRELSDQLDILTRRLGITSSSASRTVADLL